MGRVAENIGVQNMKLLTDHGFLVKHEDQVRKGQQLADFFHVRKTLPSRAPCRSFGVSYLDIRLWRTPTSVGAGFDYFIDSIALV